MYCDCFNQSSRFEYPQYFPVTTSMWDLFPHWENCIHSLSSLFGIHYSSLLSSEAVQLCNKKEKKKNESGSLCLDWGINCPVPAVAKHWSVSNYFLSPPQSVCKSRQAFYWSSAARLHIRLIFRKKRCMAVEMAALVGPSVCCLINHHMDCREIWPHIHGHLVLTSCCVHLYCEHCKNLWEN